MSGDLISDRMKNKRHYNSFHPKLGMYRRKQLFRAQWTPRLLPTSQGRYFLV
jgi:hypothetical protein